MDTYRTLGGGSIDGYFGKNPEWSKIKVKTGRTIWSSYDDNTLQAWLVEDANSGGVELAGGNYANPIQIAGNGLPRIAGYFVDGFVFENPNQVGVDASGNSWQYVGTSPLPYAVAAGTVPSQPDYEKVFESTLQNLSGLEQPSDLDKVIVRTRTLSQATAEDAPVGTRYIITDRDNSRFDIKSGITSNGYDIVDCLNGQLELSDTDTNNVLAYGLNLDGVNPDDDGFDRVVARSGKFHLKDGDGRTLYLTRKHSIIGGFYSCLKLGGAKLKLDITNVITLFGVPNSLDYAFYFDGQSVLDISDFEIEYGSVSNYTGIHRTFGISETTGDIGQGAVSFHDVKIVGGFSGSSSQGGVFINNKISKSFNFYNIEYDNSSYPTGFAQSYKVLINCELREENPAGTSVLPVNVHYHDIEMKNANAEGDGMLRIAGVDNFTIERVKCFSVNKPVKARVQDNANNINGEISENTGMIRNCKFVDFGLWAVNADTLNNQNFKPLKLTIENNVFDILTDPFGGDHWGVYLLPIHNVTINNNKFKRLHSDLRFRAYSSGESLPRGSDKTFKDISFTNNKCFGTRDRAITANDFSATYSGYGTISNLKISGNTFWGGLNTAEAYIHIEELVNSSITSDNTFGESGVAQPNRCINIGSSRLSNGCKINDIAINGDYGSNPIVYTNSANEWLGGNLIYDIKFDCTPFPVFTFAIAKPSFQNKEWYSPTNLPPSASEAESAGMKVGDIINGVVQPTEVKKWFVTDATPGAYVVGESTTSIA